MVRAGAFSDCDSGDPCLRVYKSFGDVPRTYKVVSFTEADLAKAENEGKYQLVHGKIVDDRSWSFPGYRWSHTGYSWLSRQA